MTTRTATARYDGLGRDGQGHLTTQSGVLSDQPYGFGTRFGDEPGTNPEELAAAAHAGCFTMALSFALAGAGYSAGRLETKAAVTIEKEDSGFRITRSALALTAQVDGIDEAEFARIAADAKANCPISKLFDTEITLEHRLER
ncbi:OsmC family protein [Sphingomonas sp.]|jgi:osmotically inducible protein OsmC|uniref:OsmC family protein n=1 Tax=Sphingomonas sp. TaxID=28214 RepID=UPI002DC043EC|nr:OsmC family protein [Sphingomonas sp.]HEU4968109.1 OsmC family protein [Sphingomonas sp.]